MPCSKLLLEGLEESMADPSCRVCVSARSVDRWWHLEVVTRERDVVLSRTIYRGLPKPVANRALLAPHHRHSQTRDYILLLVSYRHDQQD
jgi:hypothetical protein